MTATPSAGAIVARNSVVLFIAQIAVRLLAFIPVILLANHLGVTEYGLYSFALAFSMLFLPACDMGIDTLIVREIAARPASRAQTGRHALGLKLLLAGVAFLVIAAAAVLEGSRGDRLHVLLLAGAVTVLRTFPLTMSALFRSAQRMGIEAVLIVVQRLLEIAAVLAAVIAGLNLLTLMLLLVVAGFVSSLFAFALARHHGFAVAPAFTASSAWSLLRGGLPFALTSLAVALTFQIGTVILGSLLGEASVGIYRSAYNLVFALSGFSAAIAVALYPAVAEQHTENRQEAVRLSARAITSTLILGFPVATGCTALATPIIDTLYRADFSQAATTLRILAWWIPIMYTTTILGHILAAVNRQNLLLAISVVNAVVNVMLNLLLIPMIGHDGTAVATVATESLGLVLLSGAIYRIFGKVYDPGAIARVAAAAATILPLSLLSGTVGVIPLVIGGALVYTAALLVTGVLTREDLRRTLRLLFHPPTGQRPDVTP
ncbi:MAG: tuaB [Bacteroidetes bacterium]|nr:tuaB [Bacteroidota bacterium]